MRIIETVALSIALLLPAFVDAAEWTYQLKRDDTLVPCRARQKPR